MKYYGNDVVDHLQGKPLDNRKSQLRVITRPQNAMNRSSSKGSSSTYIGVSFNKKESKWKAQIKYDGKYITLGRFDDEIEAVEVRDVATKKYFKEFGRLNFPPQDVNPVDY